MHYALEEVGRLSCCYYRTSIYNITRYMVYTTQAKIEKEKARVNYYIEIER